MSQLISFSRYQIKCVIKFLFRQLNFTIFLGSISKARLTWKKKRKTIIQKFEYLENEKSFLDEIKNNFYSF